MFTKKISKITARQILDSRGLPTVEVSIEDSGGLMVCAQVPSGASTGAHEALELRDNEKDYCGKGVLKAIKQVEDISSEIIGLAVNQLREVDQILMDAYAQQRVAANATLGISLAVARLAAQRAKQELFIWLNSYYGFTQIKKLPRPIVNVINAGQHADALLAWQEFWLIPNFSSFAKNQQVVVESYQQLKKDLKKAGYNTNIGDEGGFAPAIADVDEAWNFLTSAVKNAGYNLQQDVELGLDAGSSTFFDSNTNQYAVTQDEKKSSEQVIELYQSWLNKYQLMAIEDGLAEDDWDGWQKMTKQLLNFKKDLLLIGDDLFTTNVERLQQGLDQKIANAILVKPNQIGTVSQTMAVIKLAQDHQYQIIISHRSGETTDDFISDLAVATQAQFIKLGAPCRGERVVKYNRLTQIENYLKQNNV